MKTLPRPGSARAHWADGATTTVAAAFDFGGTLDAITPAVNGEKVSECFYMGENLLRAQHQTDEALTPHVHSKAFRSSGVQVAVRKKASSGN